MGNAGTSGASPRTPLSGEELRLIDARWRAANYNPQFFFVFGLKDISALRTLPPAGRLDFHWARLGAEHESNGKGGADSRDWNRIFISARFVLIWGGNAFYWMLEPKIWWPFVGPGNPDLVDYVGYARSTPISAGTPC